MSIKNMLVLSAAGLTVAASSALAGGAVCPQAPDRTGVYVGANIGAVYKNYNDKSQWANHPVHHWAYTVDHDWAFAVGGDLGYMWTNYLGLEFGGFWFQSSKFDVTSLNNVATVGSFKIDNWALYLAAKMMVPLSALGVDNMYAFAKAGVGYQHQNFGSYTGAVTAATIPYTESKSAWVPMFAVGGEYYMNDNVSFNLQYMYFGDAYKQDTTTPANSETYTHKYVLTVGAAYRFQM